jgi:predicted patatin/cPLA2 family phospholipase
MRGVVSAGMVSGLEVLGLLPTFDCVYGTSAGAINGAYFIAGQAVYGTTIYYENINNEKFISFRRLFTSAPAVSLEYIFEDVVVRQKTLDWERVIGSSIPLVAVASSVTRRAAIALRGFSSRAELFDALKASARMPAITGVPVMYKDDQYVDGSVFECIPTSTAARDGCTHILALRTRPANCRVTAGSFAEKRFVGPWIRKYNADMVEDIVGQKHLYMAQLGQLKEKTETNSSGPYVCAVCLPEGTQAVGRMEKSRAMLVRSAALGMRAIVQRFTGSEVQCIETLSPFNADGHGVADAWALFGKEGRAQ